MPILSDDIAVNTPLDIGRQSSRLTVRKKHKSTVPTENSASMCGPVCLRHATNQGPRAWNSLPSSLQERTY